MEAVRLYFHFFKIHLQGMMEHKISFLLTTIGQFLVSFNVFLGIYFMMNRFHQVEGFRYPEVLLCFSITLMSFTLAEAFFRGFDMFSSMIGNGEFDRVLLRPRGTVFMVLCSKIELTRIGRLIQAIVMMAVALPGSGVRFTPVKLLAMVLMISGGTVVFACIFLIYAALCFFTLEGLEFMNVFTDGAREYGKYPVSVYGKTVLTICTYLVPYALFQYYPFLYLIGRTDDVRYALLPVGACVFWVPAYGLWRWGLRRYQSTGS